MLFLISALRRRPNMTKLAEAPATEPFLHNLEQTAVVGSQQRPPRRGLDGQRPTTVA